MSLNSGLNLRTAVEYLRNEEPDLFPDDEQPEDIRQQREIKDRVQKLHDAINEHRKKHRHHDFAHAYQALTTERPELVAGLTRTLAQSDDENGRAPAGERPLAASGSKSFPPPLRTGWNV